MILAACFTQRGHSIHINLLCFLSLAGRIALLCKSISFDLSLLCFVRIFNVTRIGVVCLDI